MRHTIERTTRFGKRLEQIRQEQGLNISELAHLAGYKSGSYISDLERGKRPVTSRVVRRLSGPLGIHPNELLVTIGIAELPWENAVLKTEQSKIQAVFTVTPDEKDLLEHYLEFIRFRASFGVYAAST